MPNVAPLGTEPGSREVDKVLDSILAANGNESLAHLLVAFLWHPRRTGM